MIDYEQFTIDIINYIDRIYSISLVGCIDDRIDGMVFKFEKNENAYLVRLSRWDRDEIYILWRRGEFDRERNKLKWQVELENCLEAR